MRGRPELGRGGRRRSRTHARRSSAPSTSAWCSARCAATSSACTRCRRGSTSTLWLPAEREAALAALLEEARRDAPNPGNGEERLPDEGNAGRLATFLAGETPDRRLLREAHRAEGRPRPARSARGPRRPCGRRRLRAGAHTLEALAADRGVRALFTGPLEHRHLRHLLALADACVVPSIFPEAFGMVAAEAAAAGCPPIVARHSGLAEVAAGLEAALPPSLAPLVVVADRRRRRASRPARAASSRFRAADRETLRATVRRVAEERWSWAGIARRLLDLSAGERRPRRRNEVV